MQYRHSIYLIHQGGQSQARLILACMGAPPKRHQKQHMQNIKPYRLIFPGLYYLQSYCWIQDCIYSIPFLDQSCFFLNLGGRCPFWDFWIYSLLSIGHHWRMFLDSIYKFLKKQENTGMWLVWSWGVI